MSKKSIIDGIKEKKGLIGEFKEFISRGNVVDLAVGVIIGSAFTAIVTSLVNDIITPLITENVLNSILKIMEKAKVSPENIDAVILTGGSSGLRPFADIILSLFGEDKIIFDDENKEQADFAFMLLK